MMDWLRENMWAGWLIVAAALGLAELASLDFTLLMLAAGALTAAGVAAFFPGLLWLQIVVGLVTAAAMLAAIRPMIVRKIHHGQELKTGSAHVIGRSGTVVKEIHPDGGGSIRLGGELWTARPYDDVSTIAPGTRVEVMSIDGATAVVYPVAEPLDRQLESTDPPQPNPTDPPQG
ncbi:NfeD family protein [Kribbella solani]|uniref:Membrane protein implicated in regulation of membrane protease activity n=1 Tax=Kribbella solani TaxID=236067 RepID=A0A841DLU5_9ACTN|nr:NfeD family protein [Kribbella solani]MBB5978669.1 membrane protein implicated in regulation of membrane protease activity [Kribbella solani]MDX2974631.1 NfeD family protein [Kribbella solani]MDX3004894.1 NfeD family protein [Kribbella solani]